MPPISPLAELNSEPGRRAADYYLDLRINHSRNNAVGRLWLSRIVRRFRLINPENLGRYLGIDTSSFKQTAVFQN